MDAVLILLEDPVGHAAEALDIDRLDWGDQFGVEFLGLQ